MNLKAADEIVLTLLKGIKQKLIKTEFNNGYLILLRLRILLYSLNNTEFIKLLKKYFTLLYNFCFKYKNLFYIYQSLKGENRRYKG